jgi:hypothetical protein
MWGPSNKSNGTPFEKTRTDHDMEKFVNLGDNDSVRLMGNEHVLIDKNNKK